MAYVLIGVILIVIIMPIIAVLPSARQKEQMKMRTAARKAGVTVELTSIDDPNPKQDKYIAHTGKPIPPVLKVAAYRLQRKRPRDWRQLPDVSWCLMKDLEGNWHWQLPPGEFMNKQLSEWLMEVAPGLPGDVVQVEEVQYTLSVYWHERTIGDEQAVFSFLNDCTQLPLIQPDPIDTA